MKVIGVTGKSGSGKTTFASLLAKKIGCKYIDIDKIGHEALFRPEIKDDLCEKFGNEILDENGNVDRKRVGRAVFGKKDKMDELTDLTWSYMQQTIDDILQQDDDAVILEWILLPKSPFWQKCDAKILVTADDTKRREKVVQRDHISEEYFNKRESSSIDYTPYEFDYIYINEDYQIEKMKEAVGSISIGNMEEVTERTSVDNREVEVDPR